MDYKNDLSGHLEVLEYNFIALDKESLVKEIFVIDPKRYDDKFEVNVTISVISDKLEPVSHIKVKMLFTLKNNVIPTKEEYDELIMDVIARTLMKLSTHMTEDTGGKFSFALPSKEELRNKNAFLGKANWN